ncbi:MAG: alpha/beta fold hydrolase [Actinomycetota bacterium]|nr:alpha/beta fold hydrolase [Actinomycetota bacterium]
MTSRTEFASGGGACAAWLTAGRGPAPRPGVVLVHGLGATHDMKLDRYEQAFAAAGFTTLGFDLRHLGASGGAPRQIISLRRQARDVEAAWRYLRERPDVDGRRVALWGTSFGATHVLRHARRNPEVAAAVIQCPIVHGPSAALASGVRPMAGLVPSVLRDAARVFTRRRRHYVAIVGDPGERALVTVPGARAGWESVVPDGHRFDNRVAAAAGLEMMVSTEARSAHRVSCPLLVCVSDRETLMSPRTVAKVAERAPQGTANHYDADHFDVYHPPLVDRMIRDQVTFLTSTLSPDAHPPGGVETSSGVHSPVAEGDA